MNARNEAKLNMYRIVKQLCDDNATSVAQVLAFQTSFNIFKAKLSSLILTVASESQVISGITIDKKVAKKNLCQTTADIAALVFAYASSINNNTLKQSVNYPYSDLYKIKDDLLSPTCQNIHALATANATALATYGITAGMLTTFQTAITDYSTAVPKPGTAKSVKATYTKNIRNLIKEIDALLKDQMDKTVVAFKPTKPDFLNSYKTARTIIDPNTTTTQLKGKVIDSVTKLPLKGANIEINANPIINILSNKLGNYIAKPLTAGTYKVTISLEGYESIIIDALNIKLGQITKQDFALIAG